MKFSAKKIEAVTGLAAPERYSHFIKVAADQRSVWGLYQDGWALMDDADGQRYFPIWPAEPYALQCADTNWDGYVPREIDLDSLIELLIPKFLEDSTGLTIFPTHANKGIALLEFDVLKSDLRAELEKLE